MLYLISYNVGDGLDILRQGDKIRPEVFKTRGFKFELEAARESMVGLTLSWPTRGRGLIITNWLTVGSREG